MVGGLKPSIERTFILEETDTALGNNGDPTLITISQATQEQRKDRTELIKIYIRTHDLYAPLDFKLVGPADIRIAEVFFTLKACNITTEEEGKEVPLFNFPLEIKEFRRAWLILPPVTWDEIHSKVLEMNPWWMTPDPGDPEWMQKFDSTKI